MDTIYIFLSGHARQNNGHAGVGICYHAAPESEPFFVDALYAGVETQNSAVYQAVKKALAQALDWGFRNVMIYNDNRLVVRQLTDNMSVRAGNIMPLYSETKLQFKDFSEVKVNFVDKGTNRRAREIAKAASQAVSHAQAGSDSVTAQAIQWSVGPGITGLVLAFTPKLMICQFKYKKGSKIGAHSHYNEQGSYIAIGKLKYRVADQDIIMTKGAALVVSGNAVHQIEALEDTTEISTYAPLRWDLINQGK